MSTPQEILAIASSCMNDTAQETYTNEVLLPYFNMAVNELLIRMEESNIPTTYKTSAQITVPTGETRIAFTGTVAQLPADLVELESVYESGNGSTWTLMGLKDFINPNIQFAQNVSSFGVYAWIGNEIIVPAATSNVYLRLEYIKKIVTTPLAIGQINTNLPIMNCKNFLGFKTGAFASMLITQDPERASVLQNQAEEAIEREMNISTKTRQAITTRRRPFRAGYKSHSY